MASPLSHEDIDCTLGAVAVVHIAAQIEKPMKTEKSDKRLVKDHLFVS